MSSFKIREPVYLSNYNIKKKDSIISHKLKLPGAFLPHIRVANGVVRGDWTGTGDDRRIGNVVDWMRYEFHYDYYQEKDEVNATNVQDYSTLIRHQIVWWNDVGTETEDMDLEYLNIFEFHGSANIDIHTPFNAKLLQDGNLIPFYDKTFSIAPVTFGNVADQTIVPEGDDIYTWDEYSVNGGKNVKYEEGIIDLAKFYRNGLRTIWGSSAEYDIQSGVLLDIWRTKFNEQRVAVDGYNRKWYFDK